MEYYAAVQENDKRGAGWWSVSKVLRLCLLRMSVIYRGYSPHSWLYH